MSDLSAQIKAYEQLAIRRQLTDFEFLGARLLQAVRHGAQGAEEVHLWRAVDNSLVLLHWAPGPNAKPAVLEVAVADPGVSDYQLRLERLQSVCEQATPGWADVSAQPVAAARQAHVLVALNAARVRAGLGSVSTADRPRDLAVHRKLCEDLNENPLWISQFGAVQQGAVFEDARSLMQRILERNANRPDIFQSQAEYVVSLTTLALFGALRQDGCSEALGVLAQARTTEAAAKLLLELPRTDYERLDACLAQTCQSVPPSRTKDWPLRAHPIDLLTTGFGRFGQKMLRLI